MSREKRRHDADFKARIAIEAIRGRYAIKEIAAIFNLNPSLVHAWKQQLLSSAAHVFKPVAAEADSASGRQLDKRIRELTAEQEWMRRTAVGMTLRDRRACVDAADPDVSILAQSRLLGLHRSGIYYKSRTRDNDYRQGVVEAAPASVNEGENHVR